MLLKAFLEDGAFADGAALLALGVHLLADEEEALLVFEGFVEVAKEHGDVAELGVGFGLGVAVAVVGGGADGFFVEFACRVVGAVLLRLLRHRHVCADEIRIRTVLQRRIARRLRQRQKRLITPHRILKAAQPFVRSPKLFMRLPFKRFVARQLHTTQAKNVKVNRRFVITTLLEEVGYFDVPNEGLYFEIQKKKPDG